MPVTSDIFVVDSSISQVQQLRMRRSSQIRLHRSVRKLSALCTQWRSFKVFPDFVPHLKESPNR